jgi:hypothetical protein
MVWWVGALWGLLGGALIEIFDLYTEIRRRHALPWQGQGRGRGSNRRPRGQPSAFIYTLASTLRLMMSCGVTAVAGASSMISAAWVAVATGISAPLILERLAKQVPLDAPPPDVIPPLQQRAEASNSMLMPTQVLAEASDSTGIVPGATLPPHPTKKLAADSES